MMFSFSELLIWFRTSVTQWICVCVCLFAACSDAEWSVSIDPHGLSLIHMELYLCCEDVSSVCLIWRHYSLETSSYKSLLPHRQYRINGPLNTHKNMYVCEWSTDILAQTKSPEDNREHTHNSFFFYVLFFILQYPCLFVSLCLFFFFQTLLTDLLEQKAHIMSSHQLAVFIKPTS